MLAEFKEFALKGNVLDSAIGVVIGGAFAKITASLVEDIINPLIGVVLGGVQGDLATRYIASDGKTYASSADAKKAGAAFSYGNFLNIVIQFSIVAFVIFIVIKQINRFTRLSGDNSPK
ncbi:hypothetical protein OY671_011958 [Metschnikowia pulcherrima]|nr:hypothetical protein OY671_011958 [Metschnikowia pulcherrima]